MNKNKIINSINNMENSINGLESWKNNIQVYLLTVVFPVGSLYINMNDVNPETFIGGKWTKISNVFLLAASAEHPNWETGGEWTHTLTQAEMPYHSHSLGSTGNSIPVTWGNINSTVFFRQNMESKTAGASFPDGFGNAVCGVQGSDAYVNPVGNSAPHNNIPPYVAVSMYYRYE